MDIFLFVLGDTRLNHALLRIIKKSPFVYKHYNGPSLYTYLYSIHEENTTNSPLPLSDRLNIKH